MKILIHSNAPWQPSGYGRQCRLLIDLFKQLGHHVTVSAISGLDGAPIDWNGTSVLPHGKANFGVDTLIGNARAARADLILTLMDTYRLSPIRHELRDFNVACWMPIDTTFRLAFPDEVFLKESGARPIAMSQHGAQLLEKEGWGGAPVIPHMHSVDEPTYLKAAEERHASRQLSGVAGRFVIGICAANNDAFRKGFTEQLEAFRRFHETHPDAFLRVHTLATGVGSGVNLQRFAHRIGLDGLVEFSDHYAQVSGLFDDEIMNDWYNQLDVLSNCSYAEGFGVTMLEAQAMGTPVVATRAAAMRDPFRAQWLVEAEPFWNYVHEAWWSRPHIGGIVKAYEKAYRYASTKRDTAREVSQSYTVESQMERWAQVLHELEPRG